MLISDPFGIDEAGAARGLHDEETSQRYVLSAHLQMMTLLLNRPGDGFCARKRIARGLAEIAALIDEYLAEQRAEVPGTWATRPELVQEIEQCLAEARSLAVDTTKGGRLAADAAAVGDTADRASLATDEVAGDAPTSGDEATSGDKTPPGATRESIRDRIEHLLRLYT